jgi:hypothetical protein
LKNATMAFFNGLLVDRAGEAIGAAPLAAGNRLP